MLLKERVAVITWGRAGDRPRYRQEIRLGRRVAGDHGA
jgi:hypothetical protein